MGLSFRNKYNRYRGIPLIQTGYGFKGYPAPSKKPRYQKGKGFGSFFKNMVKKTAPHLKNFAKKTARDMLPLAMNTATSLMSAEKGQRKQATKAGLKSMLQVAKSNAGAEMRQVLGPMSGTNTSAFPTQGQKKKKGKKNGGGQGGRGIMQLTHPLGTPNIFF